MTTGRMFPLEIAQGCKTQSAPAVLRVLAGSIATARLHSGARVIDAADLSLWLEEVADSLEMLNRTVLG